MLLKPLVLSTFRKKSCCGCSLKVARFRFVYRTPEIFKFSPQILKNRPPGIQILASSSWLPDPGYQLLATRSRLPDPGYEILATRSWLPDPDYQILTTRSCLLDPGNKIMATRSWLPQPGNEIMATRIVFHNDLLKLLKKPVWSLALGSSLYT